VINYNRETLVTDYMHWTNDVVLWDVLFIGLLQVGKFFHSPLFYQRFLEIEKCWTPANRGIFTDTLYYRFLVLLACKASLEVYLEDQSSY